MRGPADEDAVAHVGPLRVVLAGVGCAGDGVHEGPGAVEVVEVQDALDGRAGGEHRPRVGRAGGEGVEDGEDLSRVFDAGGEGRVRGFRVDGVGGVGGGEAGVGLGAERGEAGQRCCDGAGVAGVVVGDGDGAASWCGEEGGQVAVESWVGGRAPGGQQS